MDDELRQLEAELKRLQPAAVPRAVVNRIARELAAAPSAGRTDRKVSDATDSDATPGWRSKLIWLGAAALPVAAALALAFVYFSRPRTDVTADAPRASRAAAERDILKPVAAENILLSAADEGQVTLADGTPARRERLQYVDTITWRNPRTNASLKWSVPREEVRVVPIVFQ